MFLKCVGFGKMQLYRSRDFSLGINGYSDESVNTLLQATFGIQTKVTDHLGTLQARTIAEALRGQARIGVGPGFQQVVGGASACRLVYEFFAFQNSYCGAIRVRKPSDPFRNHVQCLWQIEVLLLYLVLGLHNFREGLSVIRLSFAKLGKVWFRCFGCCRDPQLFSVLLKHIGSSQQLLERVLVQKRSATLARGYFRHDLGWGRCPVTGRSVRGVPIVMQFIVQRESCIAVR